jgi:hypothetical protein
MLKVRLQKLYGLTHAELKENITNTIKNIQEHTKDLKNMYPIKTRHEKLKRIIYEFS